MAALRLPRRRAPISPWPDGMRMPLPQPASAASSMGLHDIAALALLSAIWGASFLFMRVAAPEFGPFMLILIRVGSALLMLLPIALFSGRIKLAGTNWPIVALIGLFNMALPFTLLAYATLSVTAGFASILNATTPFCTALLGFLLFGQRLTLIAVAGLCIGFLGVALLVYDPAGYATGADNLLAVGAGLGAAACYGFAANLAYRHLEGVSGMTLTVGGLGTSTLVLLPLALASQPAQWPGPLVWANVLALGLLCTGLAFLLFYRLIRRIGPQRAVMTTYLVPLFSIVWASVFLAEPITFFMLLACMLVLLGVGLTTGKLTGRRH